MEEIWCEIEGSNGWYEISSTGRIRGVDRILIKSNGSPCTVRGRVLCQNINRGGYCQCYIAYMGKKRTVSTHRLVALSFVPNPENKPEVNHIDGNKQNNNASNLEWCTPSENITHSYKLNLRVPIYAGKSGVLHNRSLGVEMFDMDMNKVNSFGSLGEAFRETGIRHVWESCNNKCNHAGGFIWRYSN